MAKEKKIRSGKKQQLQMEEGAEKKIKRLRKARIWPSIIFFMMSLFVTIFSVAVIVTIFLSYMLEEKISSAVERTKSVQSVVEKVILKETTYEEALEYLCEEECLSDAVVVLTEDDKYIAGYGEPSYNLKRQGSINLTAHFDFCMDTRSTGNIFDSEGNLKISLSKIIKQCLKDTNSEDASWLRTIIYREPYWLILRDSDKGIKILVRDELQLTRKDIIFISGMGAAITAVMFIPLFFLFIHILLGIPRQRRMFKLLSLDSVTGGNNWFFFANRTEKALYKKRNADKYYAVIHLSYSRYRSYCSCHGVKEGEHLLQQIYMFLCSKLQKDELCAHTSEADFALLIRCMEKENAGIRVMEWIKEMPLTVPQCHPSFHAGICIVNPLDKNARSKKDRHARADIPLLYHNASIARDAIPDSEETSYLLFDDKMQADQLWEHHVEETMEKALALEEFKVYLQPKYNPVTEELSGAEALVRWINETDGFINPGKFIPIFEKNGFITKLDDYMISHVAALQKGWLNEGKKVVPVSVNVSRAHFTSPDLAEHICKLVDAYELPHELIEIELTESAFFDDKAVLLKTVKELRTQDFLVSMDDFGAGYSSLNSLKELPLDILKLDAEFFRGQYEKERGDIVVSEAIRLAKSLNMKIVAEGIEEKEQVDFLAGLGCDMIQGFYFARPMPSNEFEVKL